MELYVLDISGVISKTKKEIIRISTLKKRVIRVFNSRYNLQFWYTGCAFLFSKLYISGSRILKHLKNGKSEVNRSKTKTTLQHVPKYRLGISVSFLEVTDRKFEQMYCIGDTSSTDELGNSCNCHLNNIT